MKATAHVLVVGNCKGGCGKSTTALHLAVGLAHLGARVAILDCDSSQQTAQRFFDNRARYCAQTGAALPKPLCRVIKDEADLTAALASVQGNCDYVVIDCPGADTPLVRFAHGLADTLISPINESFVDIDLLGDICPQTFVVKKPSWYSEMIWQLRKDRFAQGKAALDWVVVQNRTTHTASRNKQHVSAALGRLACSVGFRVLAGLGDRVIFRELFLQGLTLSDLKGGQAKIKLTMTHIAAAQEVRSLLLTLKLRPKALEVPAIRGKRRLPRPRPAPQARPRSSKAASVAASASAAPAVHSHP